MDYFPNIDPKKLFHYWRNTLADEDLMSLDSKGCVLSIEHAIIQSGCLDEKSVKLLQEAWREYKKKATWNQTSADLKNYSDDTIPIIILSKGFAPKHNHGKPFGSKKTNSSYYVLHIPAFLTPSGKLSVQGESIPWIGRDYLWPNAEAEESIPIVAELDKFDEWVSRNPMEATSWVDLMEWCDQLCEEVIGSRIPNGFVQLEDAKVNISKSVKNAGRNICQLYDCLHENKELPALLQKLCHGCQRKVEVEEGLRKKQLSAFRASMSIEYGLAERQSDALAAYSAMDKGEILAINGPPGTGKTTLLQSIIASEVVEKAIEGCDPAVIVGSSMNNQAIQNINKGMNEISKGNPADSKFLWANRWVPDANTYGLYLPAGDEKIKEAIQKGYAYAVYKDKEWSGFPEREQDEAYVKEAETQWRDNFFKVYNKEPASIAEGLQVLRKELKLIYGKIRDIQECFNRYDVISNWWRQTSKGLPLGDYLKEQDELLSLKIDNAEKYSEVIRSELDQLIENRKVAHINESDNKVELVKIRAERCKYQSELIEIKSNINKVLAPHGIYELIASSVKFFRGFFVRRQIYRLCFLVANDEVAKDIFEEQLKGNNPNEWSSRINSILEEHNALMKKSSLDEVKVEQRLLQEVKVADQRVSEAEKAYLCAKKQVQEAVDYRKSFLSEVRAKIFELEKSEQSLESAYEQLRNQAVSEFRIDEDKIQKTTNLPTVSDFDKILDVTYRYMAFQKAMRYWEGRWILEVQKILEGSVKTNKGQDAMEARFRRWCMLTPCIIVTAYSLPKHFRHQSKFIRKNNVSTFMLDYIDLLIVDEAGQVGPHIGASSFAFAKRAVVVGDIYQLEPVSKVSRGADQGNCIRLGLEQLWEDGDPLSPHLVSEPSDKSPMGSVMRLAQAATRFVSPATENEPGIFLEEHRRCRKEIIRYCDKLIYNDRLIPKTPPRAKEPPLPPIGWAHVRGEEIKVGGSRKNPLEAEAIVGWIQKNADAWISYYEKSIDNVVAVVAPFKPQVELIQKHLRAIGHGFEKITVGTVHCLQGDEKPIVIFSPTYNEVISKNLFFNRKPNMLNVAVSRAKDSFVVIGDMRLFHGSDKTPSGLLGQFLFESEKNEILDVDGNYRFLRQWLTTAERISTLDRHREVLQSFLIQCQKNQSVLIVSPWITYKAIKEDDLVNLIQAAVRERGAKVWIVVDRYLSMSKPSHRGVEAMDALQEAGAMVWKINKIHNKTLIFSYSEIVEGSFNWLSAQRNREGQYARHEVSWRVSGEKASEAIHLALEEFKQLGVRLKRSNGDGFSDD